ARRGRSTRGQPRPGRCARAGAGRDRRAHRSRHERRRATGDRAAPSDVRLGPGGGLHPGPGTRPRRAVPRRRRRGRGRHLHIWWDPQVATQIARAAGRIASYQVCDWATPLPADVLLSRHYPGEGVIDFEVLTRAVRAAGYDGDIEVEIFNADVWRAPYADVARRTSESFDEGVAPHLGRQGA